MAESPSMPIDSDKVWVTLITNTSYLPGLLTLAHSLRAVHTKYPLLALHTGSLPSSALSALQVRSIPSLTVPFLSPRSGKHFDQDPRFNDCWTKLIVFHLRRFKRITYLDADMVVLRNMDELMDLDFSPNLFAASHACVCNPLGRAHYPSTWTRSNCAFTKQHDDPSVAQIKGLDPAGTLGALNSGLLVLDPSETLFEQILERMDSHGEGYIFPDQDLLADLYKGQWMPLPYVYNALKTMKRPDVHGAIWRDECVKNVHFILSPKPWGEFDERGVWTGSDDTHRLWVDMNARRVEEERERGLLDG